MAQKFSQAAVRCCALLCAEKTSAPCKISTKHKLHSMLSFCERGSVRCMDAAWRGADGSSTQQPRLYDCRRSSTCSDGFTTNVACRRSFRCSALHHTNLLRSLLRHVRDERSLPPKHSLLYAALRCSALLCAAPHRPIKKTSAQCKISTEHKPPSRFNFCERGKCAMRCSQDCRAPPQQV